MELEDESAVLLGDTAFFSDRDAAGGETIQNIFLWDGYVENDGKVFKPDYEPGRYVIVMRRSILRQRRTTASLPLKLLIAKISAILSRISTVMKISWKL